MSCCSTQSSRLCGVKRSWRYLAFRRFLSTPSPHQDPLRILFCGADEFSAVSLRRLHRELREHNGLISSLQVVCKPAKPTGRGLKQMRDVPIKAVANSLSLPLHEIPTFTGWTPPSSDGPIDLVIAVSFGLLVPPRILRNAKHGGLNVHPSLLPDLRGPAPLHHALLQGRKTSGITVQTLHPEHFDRGDVVNQRHFTLPNGGECTLQELQEYVAPLAAETLLEHLRGGISGQITPTKPDQDDAGGSHHHALLSGPAPSMASRAPKITPQDSKVDWTTWDSTKILRAQRVLGSVWNFMPSGKNDGKHLRVRWHGLRDYPLTREGSRPLAHDQSPGAPKIIALGNEEPSYKAQRRDCVLIPTVDRKYLIPDGVTVEGRKAHEDPARAIAPLIDDRM